MGVQVIWAAEARWSVRRLQEGAGEDEDVAAERARVASGGAASDSLCLRNLRKVYGSGAGAKVGFPCWAHALAACRRARQ
jgi:hypothetical protein